MRISNQIRWLFCCLVAALVPMATLIAGPQQDEVSGDDLQPVVSEPAPAPAPSGMTHEPAFQTAPRGTCHCRICMAKRGSSWSRYKARRQEQYWGYPEYFDEVGFGVLSTELIRPQVLRGEAARLTIYEYDFFTGTARLNQRGVQRVLHLAQQAAVTGQTIVVQSLGDELDHQRHQSVLAMAATTQLKPAQVVSGTPIAAGVSGEEALIHRSTALDNVREYGVRQFQFGSDSGGFGTSGFGNSGIGTSSSR